MTTCPSVVRQSILTPLVWHLLAGQSTFQLFLSQFPLVHAGCGGPSLTLVTPTNSMLYFFPRLPCASNHSPWIVTISSSHAHKHMNTILPHRSNTQDHRFKYAKN